MNKLVLKGCRSTPLSSYLKALGIIRLTAEQKDSGVKGWWEGQTFIISSKLNKDDFSTFFCKEYAPTTIVSPWNGGSGFYLGDAVDGINAIAANEHNRFEAYRETISQVMKWPEIPSFNKVDDINQTLSSSIKSMKPGKKRDEIEEMLERIDTKAPAAEILGGEDPLEIDLSKIEALKNDRGEPNQEAWKLWWDVIKKARTKCNTIRRNENKKTILPLCRSRFSESALPWIDAVYALQKDGQAFNPILGTGGNEGRLDLSNNFMQRLVDLFIAGDPEKTLALFNSSVFGAVCPGLSKAKIGQYDPGRAGGYNQGMEVETKDFKINPWDFILTLEGAIVLAGAVVRRHPTEERSLFTAPFTVFFSPVGFSSSAYEETGRYETWLPLWPNPTTYVEIKYLFGEGRSTVGRKVARTGIDFSKAVGTLGVDRGINGFERYAYLQRRGQSKVALPLGRIKVQYKPELELLNELDPLMGSLDRFMRDFKNVPATFQSTRQNIDEAIFACCQNSDPLHFSNLVRAIGNLEKLIAMRDRAKKPALARPLFGLSPRWITYCDDGRPEIRLAASFASIKRTDEVGSIRSNMAGLDPTNPWRWSEGKGQRHWYGNSATERLAAVLSRRLMDAEKTATSRIPIESDLPISAYDVLPFLWNECDDIKMEELLWGFTTIDWKKLGLKQLRKCWRQPLNTHPLSRTWCLLKLLHFPGKIRGISTKIEPRIAYLLVAGRIKDACNVAINRLHVSGLHPFKVTYEEQVNPTRLLASLLAPVKDQWILESQVLEKQPDNA